MFGVERRTGIKGTVFFNLVVFSSDNMTQIILVITSHYSDFLSILDKSKVFKSFSSRRTESQFLWTI